jgi:hypothetical protein
MVQFTANDCMLNITTEAISAITRLIDSSRRLKLDQTGHEPTYGYNAKIGSSRTSGREDHIGFESAST